METVGQPPAHAELHLLTDWSEPGGRARMGRSAILSLLTHAAAIMFVLFVHETFMQPSPRARETVVTPLILPPLTLTQTEPNPSKTIRAVRSTDMTPRIKAPSGPSPEPEAAAPRKPVAPPPPPPKASPQTPLPEPPKLQIAANETPKLTLPVQSPQVPQPKPSFEDVNPVKVVPPGERVVDIAGPSVASAIRGSLQGRGGANIPGTGPVASSGADLPQLLSDPQGVDFRPYLEEVLDSVRRYWKSILPTAVLKAGLRGYVSVQFAIQRDGTVRKVAFAQQTGNPTLDNTAIAAISGGGPFGPLPAQYRGGEIHVQMNFSYNDPRH